MTNTTDLSATVNENPPTLHLVWPQWQGASVEAIRELFPEVPLKSLQGVSISKPAFCTLNDLSQNARRGMSSLRRVEDCFPHLIASIAASIAPQRVTPQPASSYGLHGADPGSVPFSPVTPPRVTLYGKLYLQR